MSDLVLIALIAATPPTIVAATAAVIAWRGRKKVEKRFDQAEQSLNAITINMDGRLSELLTTTKALARSEGQAEGKERERGEERARHEK